MKPNWDELADVVKVARFVVLIWAWAVVMCVCGWGAWEIWCAAWDSIARWEWLP